MDWHEGFQIYGENGSVIAKIFNLLFRTSKVDIFRESGDSSRPRRRRAFLPSAARNANAVLNDSPVSGADITDGVASIRAMLAIRQSARTGKPVKLSDVSGAV